MFIPLILMKERIFDNGVIDEVDGIVGNDVALPTFVEILDFQCRFGPSLATF